MMLNSRLAGVVVVAFLISTLATVCTEIYASLMKLAADAASFMSDA